MTVGLGLAVNYSTIEQVFVITGRGATGEWAQEEVDLLREIGALEVDGGAAEPVGADEEETTAGTPASEGEAGAGGAGPGGAEGE